MTQATILPAALVWLLTTPAWMADDVRAVALEQFPRLSSAQLDLLHLVAEERIRQELAA